jgi:hypothetical protein
VTLLDGLATRGGHADCEVARNFLAFFFPVFFLVLEEVRSGERQHIGRLIEAAELAIETANGTVGREEN